jgi:hypothetical protein
MKNLICATLLTGIFDVNRNQTLPNNSFNIIEKWYASVINLKLNGVVFHNALSPETVIKYQNEYIKFIKIDYNNQLNTNTYRYIIYNHFLKENSHQIANVFFTDITDVEVVINPFLQPLFLTNKAKLFCGDEPKILNNEWMQNHCTHLRNNLVDFADFEAENSNETLLNCGIIGGNITVMQRLITQLTNLHLTYTISNASAFTLDMGAFNYIARTQFKNNLLHGYPINTAFKKMENLRTDCWFRHK